MGSFSPDGTRIVASGARIADLVDQVRSAGEDMQNVGLGHIVVDSDEIYLGGAEYEFDYQATILP